MLSLNCFTAPDLCIGFSWYAHACNLCRNTWTCLQLQYAFKDKKDRKSPTDSYTRETSTKDALTNQTVISNWLLQIANHNRILIMGVIKKVEPVPAACDWLSLAAASGWIYVSKLMQRFLCELITLGCCPGAETPFTQYPFLYGSRCSYCCFVHFIHAHMSVHTHHHLLCQGSLSHCLSSHTMQLAVIGSTPSRQA